MLPTSLLCTVGTSLFFPNLQNLSREEHPVLCDAYQARDWDAVARALATLDPRARLCGAEINSVQSMLDRGLVAADARLLFFHSDSGDGEAIGEVLRAYYSLRGFNASSVLVEDLQDRDPHLFCTRGLRNLAKLLCKAARDYGAPACAINATGGYKAQIAVGMLLGQAMGIPVYYKHERFDEVVAFPPMPVALDFDYWMEISGPLFDLARCADLVPAAEHGDLLDDRAAALCNIVTIDQVDYVELSPAGQIFHETFRERFRARFDLLLPPPVEKARKRPPRWEDDGHIQIHKDVMRFMEDLTREVDQVASCQTYYYHPSLPNRIGARVGARGVEVVFSDGSYTVKIRVESSAANDAERRAVAARINLWLDESKWAA